MAINYGEHAEVGAKNASAKIQMASVIKLFLKRDQDKNDKRRFSPIPDRSASRRDRY